MCMKRKMLKENYCVNEKIRLKLNIELGCVKKETFMVSLFQRK